jgi:hypothetical protein
MVSLGLGPTSRLAPDANREWEKDRTEHRRQHIGGMTYEVCPRVEGRPRMRGRHEAGIVCPT